MGYRYLTLDEIKKIHEYIALKYEFHPSILNQSNLERCVDKPQLMLFGSEIHKTVFEKAASLLHEICKLHPFAAGNKRTAYEVVDVFMNLNRYKVKSSFEDAVKISVKTAECSAGMMEITEWIKIHSHRSYERLGE